LQSTAFLIVLYHAVAHVVMSEAMAVYPNLLSRTPDLSQSVLQCVADAINQMILPARYDIGWVQRDGVELIFPVNAKFMPCLFGVMLVTIHAKVFDEEAVLQREIGVPHLEFSVIYDSRGFLVNERNLAFRQKISNLPLNAGFVFRPAA